MIGITMLVLMFWVYIEFFAPEPPPGQITTTEQNQSNPTNNATSTIDVPAKSVVIPDSVLRVQRESQFGAFVDAAVGEDREFTVENEDVQITFSTLGGSIREVLIKKHLTYLGEPLIISDQSNLEISRILSSQGKPLDIKDLYFSTRARSTIVNQGDTTRIVFTLEHGRQSIHRTRVLHCK